MCESIVPLFSDMIINVGRNLSLDSSQICGTLFGDTCAHTADVMWKTKVWEAGGMDEIMNESDVVAT